MKDTKATVFCPYFGKLPDHFQLWLNSCEKNVAFYFVIFTNDITGYCVPHNVEIIHMSFEEFKDIIQRKFDFKICLQKPYKLCDFKVTYGYVLEEYIKEGYNQYWGHCDLDLIFGDLMNFLPKESYDKVSYMGHFSLYRNSKEINEMFMQQRKGITYREILSMPIGFGFDEIGAYGVNELMNDNGCSVYHFENSVANVYALSKNMELSSYHDDIRFIEREPRIFSYENGKILSWSVSDNKLIKKEYAYLHFQKRKMSLALTKDNEMTHYLICPHSFENYQPISINVVLSFQYDGIYHEKYNIMRKAAVNKLKRKVAVIKSQMKK